MTSGLPNADTSSSGVAYSKSPAKSWAFFFEGVEIEFFYSILLMLTLGSLIVPSLNLQIVVIGLLLMAIRHENTSLYKRVRVWPLA